MLFSMLVGILHGVCCKDSVESDSSGSDEDGYQTVVEGLRLMPSSGDTTREADRYKL